MNARAIGATLLISGLLGCGAGDERPAAPAAAAPAPEAAEFQAICRGFRESEHLFYGEQTARRLEARLAGIEAGRESIPPVGHERVALALASEWIELGRQDDALALLARTQAGAPVLEAAARAPSAGAPRVDAAVAGSAADDAILRLTLERDAHLQAAEDMNCLLNHSAAACILPFEPEALHKYPEHARRAAELSLAILARRPDSVSARWFVNLMRMVTNEASAVPPQWRLPEQALASEEDFPRWRDRAPDLGVNVSDLAGGAVMDDFDGDGFLDLVSSTANPCDHVKAFRSDGHGDFEDVAAAWGLDTQLGGLNLIHGDYDGDGALDLLVLRGGWLGASGRVRKSLLHNALATEGRFVDVTRAAGLAEPAFPTQTAAFADYDGDGDLDLYAGHEAWTERPYPSVLYRNEGDGTFRDVAEAAGVAHPGFVKGVAWGDFDDDGDPDLYVSCIGPNHLYRNDGNGKFTDVTAEYGVEEPKGRSFTTWFFDFDNDGRLDLFVADYGAAPEATMASYFGQPSGAGHPLVYHNEGGRFRDVSEAMGMTRPLLPMGSNYGDLDNDGWPDVYLGTGNPGLASLVPNAMYRNRGGTRFVDVSFAGGFAHLQKGHGVAFGDIDGDGDQDLFHQLGGFYPADDYGNALFENPGFGASWITLRLVGRRANRFGVGARIAVRVREGGAPRTIHALAGSGGSFGDSSLQQEIGLGAAEAIEEIRIRWPGSGTEQAFRDVALDRVYVADEGEEALREVPARAFALGANGGQPHVHK